MSDNEENEDGYGSEEDDGGEYGAGGEGEYVEDDGEAEEEEDYDDDEDEEAMIKRRQMQALQRKKGGSVRERERIVSDLMKYFGKLVTYSTTNDVRDHRGKVRDEDKKYMKLPNAYMYVKKIIKTLKDPLKINKDFLFFIARKNWIPTTLRPLLELCRSDDPRTSYNSVQLAFLLLEINDELGTYLRERSKKVRKASSSSSKEGENGGEDNENEDNNENEESKDKNEKNDSKKKSIDIQINTATGVKLMEKSKASEYMSALHTIKEGLCSEKANDAICSIFKNAWVYEMNRASDVDDDERESLKSLKLCFFYIRRLFLIEPVSDLMANVGSEMASALKVHFNYIIQLRPILANIPYICSDLILFERVDNGENVLKINEFHNLWLKDVITILANCLKNFSSRDMFDVFKDGKIIKFGNGAFETDVENVEREENQNIVVPESIQKRNMPSELSKGKLRELVEKQKESRQTAVQGRHSRFGGVFRINTGAGASSSAAGGVGAPFGSSSNTNTNSSIGLDQNTNKSQMNSKLVKNPFQKEMTIPEAKSKRNVKNMTFALDSVFDNKAQQEPLRLDEGQKALVVAASLVDMMVNFSADDKTSFPGIRNLIKRVNEDKRRDENIIDNASELRFFQILHKCLCYYRMKLNFEKKQFEERTSLASNTSLGQMEDSENQWVPEVKNIIDCLSVRTVNRVTSTMERLFKIDKDFNQVIYAMEVYKEQICYIKILLESAEEPHNFMAMFNLSRLFYSPSGRLDMLPKLLAAWRPGVYDRKHLVMLVEILHETMKTLRFAKAKYYDESLADSSKKGADGKKKKKKYMNKDMDGLVLSCHSFDVDEYFKRLITNHSVRLYTRLLKEYKTLEPATVHYVYVFFQDICKFKLERRMDGRSPAEIEHLVAQTQSAQASNSNSNSNSYSSSSGRSSNAVAKAFDNSEKNDDLTLSYMLLNIHTFCVFSDILNDSSIEKNKLFDPLIRLIRSLVRKFVQVAKRNHMMYVEILFQHAHPHDICESFDNVYDATAFYESYTKGSSRYGSSKERGGIMDLSGSDSGSESDLVVSDSEKVTKKKDKVKGKEKDKKKKKNKDRSKDRNKDSNSKDMDESSDDDDDDDDNKTQRDGSEKTQDDPPSAKKRTVIADDEDEFDIFNPPSIPNPDDANDASKAKGKKRRRKPANTGNTRTGGVLGGLGAGKKKKWTQEEDDILRAQYPIYAGISSVYDVLSQDADLTLIGNNRDTTQVQKRVRELGLDASGAVGAVFGDEEMPDDSFFMSDDDAAAAGTYNSDENGNDDDDDDNDDGDSVVGGDNSGDIDGTFPQDAFDDANLMPINIASAALLSPQSMPKGRGGIFSPTGGGLDHDRDNSIFDDIFKDHDDAEDTTADKGVTGKFNSNILDSIDMSDDSDKERSQVKRKRLVRKRAKVAADDSEDDF